MGNRFQGLGGGLLAIAANVAILAGPARAENAGIPVRPPSGACAKIAAVAAVTVPSLAWADGKLSASGAWQAGGGAKGLLLEVRIDSDLDQGESWTGAAGRWDYAADYKECGPHLFEVFVFPTLVEGGRDVHCLTRGQSARGKFTVACAPSAELECDDWKCAGGKCSGICTGKGLNGRWGYTPFFGVNDAEFKYLDASPGPWTQEVTCAPGERISFKVRDRLGAGVFSAVVEQPCGKP